MESGIIDIALISNDMYHKTVLTTPAYQEPFVLVGGPAWDNTDVIHPTQFNPCHEIRLPWNPEFDAWHDHWFDVTLYPRVRLDQMSLLEEFLTGSNFALVPLLVARSLHQGQMHLCRLTDGPDDEIIYYLTCSGRQHSNTLLAADGSLIHDKAPIVKHFLQLLQEELQKWEGVRSFL